MRRIRGLAVLWAVATAVLLLVPGDGGSRTGLPEALVTAVELAVHFALFFGQAYVAVREFSEPSRDSVAQPETAGRRSRILAAVLAYCVLLEIAQIAVPGRAFEFADIAAGWAGAVLGIRGQIASSRWRR